MAVLYRIKEWDEHFENNRTRELKHMDWVPLPNKHDGDGYTELLSHPDGAAHFGAWVAIVQVASKCKPRGTLVRSIPQEGAGIPQAPAEGGRTPLRPHDSTSLSRITRIPAKVFDAVIPRLIQIGWLTSQMVVSSTDTAIPQEGAGSSAQSRTRVRESDYGTEGNGTEGLSAGADVPTPVADDPANQQAAPSGDAGNAGKSGGRKVREPKPKADAEPSDHIATRDYFRERWKARNEADYAWKFGRDDKHLKWILDTCGRDARQAKGIIDAFLADDERWVAEKGHELALLVSRFNRYRAKPPADPNVDGFERAERTDAEWDAFLLEGANGGNGG